jgi:hypothetical protein
MGFKEQAGYAADPDFRKRVLVASLTAAVAIQGESKGSLKSGEYDKRQVLATKLIQTGGLGTVNEDLQRMFVWAVITNVAITSASLDSDIQFAVNSLFSKCAGATGTEV